MPFWLLKKDFTLIIFNLKFRLLFNKIMITIYIDFVLLNQKLFYFCPALQAWFQVESHQCNKRRVNSRGSRNWSRELTFMMIVAVLIKRTIRWMSFTMIEFRSGWTCQNKYQINLFKHPTAQTREVIISQYQDFSWWKALIFWGNFIFKLTFCRNLQNLLQNSNNALFNIYRQLCDLKNIGSQN